VQKRHEYDKNLISNVVSVLKSLIDFGPYICFLLS